MDFNKLIVGKRDGLSQRFSDADDVPVIEGEARRAKPGQLFIAENGGVYKRKEDGSTKEVMLPAHLPAQKLKHSADDREKRKKLMRLKMMVQMRDLAGDIVEMYINEKARVQTGLAPAGKPKPWAALQDELKALYKSFAWQFDAIKHVETVETGQMDSNGQRALKTIRPNMKKFNKDPETLLFNAIEIYDEKTGAAALGPIFDEDLDLDALLGLNEEAPSISQAQVPGPAPG